MPYKITEKRRSLYRLTSLRAQARKRRAVAGQALKPVHPINEPNLDPNDLMPQIPAHGLRALSLFSGGGGLDLGFERAGYAHAASYELLPVCGDTLHNNRPEWNTFSGDEGDVTRANWRIYRNEIDVLHGGPPCQPFSIAGNQAGADDPRNMWPAFVSAVRSVRPRAFVAENVLGLLDAKFASFVRGVIEAPLAHAYHITRFALSAESFGVPQSRKRVFFVGFRDAADFTSYQIPTSTHTVDDDLCYGLQRCMGVRSALGLPNTGFDWVAPTLRSGFTGPRNTTGVVNSKASMLLWHKLGLWPNGVQPDRRAARQFPPENQHFRLSVQDCGIIQGFPESWRFSGAVYQILGQIGNSVCPPVGYAVAQSVARTLLR